MGRGGVRPSAAGSSVEVAALFTASTQNLEEGMGRIQKAFGNTQRTIAGFVGAVSFVGMTRQISEITSEAVKFERVASGFEALATRFGMSSQKIISDVQKTTQGQIATVQIMESVNKALTLLPPSAERLTELSTIATGAAAALGLDVRRAFDDITTGIGRASPKILDNLGIIVNAREAYKEYAVAVRKSATDLTAEEKQIALLNQVIDRNIERFKVIADSVSADPFQQVSASLTDLRIEFGRTFEGGYRYILQFITGVTDTKDELQRLAAVGHDLLQLIISIGATIVTIRTGAALKGMAAGFAAEFAGFAAASKQDIQFMQSFQRDVLAGTLLNLRAGGTAGQKAFTTMIIRESQISNKPLVELVEQYQKIPIYSARANAALNASGMSMMALGMKANQLGIVFKGNETVTEKLALINQAYAKSAEAAARATSVFFATLRSFAIIAIITVAIYGLIKAFEAYPNAIEKARRAIEDLKKEQQGFISQRESVVQALSAMPLELQEKYLKGADLGNLTVADTKKVQETDKALKEMSDTVIKTYKDFEEMNEKFIKSEEGVKIWNELTEAIKQADNITVRMSQNDLVRIQNLESYLQKMKDLADLEKDIQKFTRWESSITEPNMVAVLPEALVKKRDELQAALNGMTNGIGMQNDLLETQLSILDEIQGKVYDIGKEYEINSQVLDNMVKAGVVTPLDAARKRVSELTKDLTDLNTAQVKISKEVQEIGVPTNEKGILPLPAFSLESVIKWKDSVKELGNFWEGISDKSKRSTKELGAIVGFSPEAKKAWDENTASIQKTTEELLKWEAIVKSSEAIAAFIKQLKEFDNAIDDYRKKMTSLFIESQTQIVSQAKFISGVAKARQDLVISTLSTYRNLMEDAQKAGLSTDKVKNKFIEISKDVITQVGISSDKIFGKTAEELEAFLISIAIKFGNIIDEVDNKLNKLSKSIEETATKIQRITELRGLALQRNTSLSSRGMITANYVNQIMGLQNLADLYRKSMESINQFGSLEEKAVYEEAFKNLVSIVHDRNVLMENYLTDLQKADIAYTEKLYDAASAMRQHLIDFRAKMQTLKLEGAYFEFSGLKQLESLRIEQQRIQSQISEAQNQQRKIISSDLPFKEIVDNFLSLQDRITELKEELVLNTEELKQWRISSIDAWLYSSFAGPEGIMRGAGRGAFSFGRGVFDTLVNSYIPELNRKAWAGGGKPPSELMQLFQGGVSGLSGKWGTDLASKWNLPTEMAGPIGSIISSTIGFVANRLWGREQPLKIEQPVDIRIVDIETRLGNFFNFRNLNSFVYGESMQSYFESGGG